MQVRDRAFTNDPEQLIQHGNFSYPPRTYPDSHLYLEMPNGCAIPTILISF